MLYLIKLCLCVSAVNFLSPHAVPLKLLTLNLGWNIVPALTSIRSLIA